MALILDVRYGGVRVDALPPRRMTDSRLVLGIRKGSTSTQAFLDLGQVVQLRDYLNDLIEEG